VCVRVPKTRHHKRRSSVARGYAAAMNARPHALTLAFALVAVGSAISGAATTSADAAVSVFTCNQVRWCTITASGDVTATASQLAIGNVSGETGLAVVLSEHHQYGGEILGGNLRGLCAWSQYARDWTAARRSKDANCARLVLNTPAFVASNGRAASKEPSKILIFRSFEAGEGTRTPVT